MEKLAKCMLVDKKHQIYLNTINIYQLIGKFFSINTVRILILSKITSYIYPNYLYKTKSIFTLYLKE